MAKEIMKPNNKRWKEFTKRLEGSEGCNFKLKDKNDPMSFTFKSINTMPPDRGYATQICNACATGKASFYHHVY